MSASPWGRGTPSSRAPQPHPAPSSSNCLSVPFLPSVVTNQQQDEPCLLEFSDLSQEVPEPEEGLGETPVRGPLDRNGGDRAPPLTAGV